MNEQTYKTYFVSPLGDDSWSGEIPDPTPDRTDGPFASLQRARDALRDLKSTPTGLAGPAMVLIRAGVYSLEKTLVLTEEDSGTRECPITWRAYPGEQPILSGGSYVTGWQPYQGGIWQAYVPFDGSGSTLPRQLFYRGQRQRRARWPKFDPQNPIRGGWLFPEGPVPEFGLRAFHFREGSFPHKWAKPQQGEVKIFIGHGWMHNTIPIQAIDEEQRILWLAHETFDIDLPPWFMRVPLGENSRFLVENLLEELTEPGEWCYDSSQATLYFWCPEGPPGDQEVLTPHLDCLVRLRDVEWLTLAGLRFTHTTSGDDLHRIRLEGYGAMYPQRGWSYCGEALHLRGTRYCAVQSCQFDQVGGNAIYLERDNYRDRIQDNEIAYAGANGVVLIGDRAFHPMYNEVVDNHIHHCGVQLNYVAGVFLGASDSNIVAHNSIHDMPHHAVNLGSNGLGRNYVEYNEIRRVCLEIADTGAINCWMDVPGGWIEAHAERSGHVIRNNLIVDVPGCVVENGQIIDDRTTRGIYLDDCTSNCLVTGNVIVRAGMGFMTHGGKHNLIENNLVVDCRIGLHGDDWPPRRPGNAHILGMFRANRFVRNIVYSTRSEAYPYFFWSWDDRQFAWCDENIFFLPGAADYRVPGLFPGQDVLSSTYEDWRKLGFDRRSIIADPQMIDPASEDYRLLPTSPAIQMGFQPIDFSKIGIRRA